MGLLPFPRPMLLPATRLTRIWQWGGSGWSTPGAALPASPGWTGSRKSPAQRGYKLSKGENVNPCLDIHDKDQGHNWILIWLEKIYLFAEHFGCVMQVQMRAVRIWNKREYVIEFICVVERLDLLYDQILADVGGHFCEGSWSINDEPSFLFSRRLLLWSDSQGGFWMAHDDPSFQSQQLFHYSWAFTFHYLE